MAQKSSYQLDCANTNVDEEYEDSIDNVVPVFVKHTQAMLDEIDRIVSALI